MMQIPALASPQRLTLVCQEKARKKSQSILASLSTFWEQENVTGNTCCGTKNIALVLVHHAPLVWTQ